MASFVIVHGAFGGGWEWTPVAPIQRRSGHEVFTPTLSGMGERAHLGPRVGLTTHVDDILAVLEFEDMQDVVLCAASYGGMAVTAVADRVPARVALVIYIDALIPRDGQSGLDLLPQGFGEAIQKAMDPEGHGWADVPPGALPPDGLIPVADRDRYLARLRPQPIATFSEPIHLTGAVDQLPRAFIRCTYGGLASGADPIAPMAARARDEAWPYRELHLPHDPHLFDPDSTAAAILELARTLTNR
jgi:pimeloyl-ACP methyl ester carboxylesterase